jgi:hypothetical protein
VHFSFSPVCTTCLARLILLDLTTGTNHERTLRSQRNFIILTFHQILAL